MIFFLFLRKVKVYDKYVLPRPFHYNNGIAFLCNCSVENKKGIVSQNGYVLFVPEKSSYTKRLRLSI